MSNFVNGYNQEQLNQRMANLQMRGAQIAAKKQGVEFEMEPQTKAKGTKKQLIGTIAGIAAVILALVLLKMLGVI